MVCLFPEACLETVNPIDFMLGTLTLQCRNYQCLAGHMNLRLRLDIFAAWSISILQTHFVYFNHFLFQAELRGWD